MRRTAALAAVLLAACAETPPPLHVLRGTTMGTTYTIKYVGEIEPADMGREVIATLEAANELFSTYDQESEISRFNDRRVTDPVEVTQSFWEAVQVRGRSGGQDRRCVRPDGVPPGQPLRLRPRRQAGDPRRCGDRLDAGARWLREARGARRRAPAQGDPQPGAGLQRDGQGPGRGLGGGAARITRHHELHGGGRRRGALRRREGRRRAVGDRHRGSRWRAADQRHRGRSSCAMRRWRPAGAIATSCARAAAR